MYFRGWLHSWTCGDCSDADVYWRLRAFWAGVICGVMVLSPVMRNWSFSYETEEFEF